MRLALNAIKTMASGVNWPMLFYKIAATGAVLLILLTAVYREGLHDGESRALAEQMGNLKTQIVEERETIVKELTTRENRMVIRLNEIGEDSKRTAQLHKKIYESGENLHELIKQMPSNPACAPTAGMWEEYRKLAEATNPTP